MSSSNCFFLTWKQIFQEAGQVVWYSHLVQNFSWFIVIHTVKYFGIVNKAKVDVFVELSCFFNDPTDVGNLNSGSLAFSKSSLNIRKFTVHVLLKPDLENFEHYLASGWDECNDLFRSCGHCFFQICWHIECSTLAASSFRIWSSSVGIPPPPLALFIVMLPKAHLTLHSRISGSRWMITPSWLSGSWSSSLYSSSVYSCHFLISSASTSVRSITFLSFIVPISAWSVPLVSLVFLRRSLGFPILLFSSIALHWSLRKTFLYLLAVLWNLAFRWLFPFLLCLLLLFFSQLFVRAPQTTILSFK